MAATLRMIPVVVDNRVRLPTDTLPKKVVGDLIAEFTHQNPAFEADKRLRERLKRLPKKDIPPTIETFKWDAPGKLSFPRGGFWRVRKILRAAGFQYDVQDNRTLGVPLVGDDVFPPHNVTAWEHQADMVEAAAASENAILRAPTGSGKTTAAFAFLARVGLRALIVVPTKAILRVWEKRLVKEFGLRPGQFGILGGGRRKTTIGPVTLAIQGTVYALLKAGKLDQYLDLFGVVLFDEVHKFAATTFLETVDPWPAKFRIGVSADETRHDGKEFLLYDLLGRVAIDVNREELIQKGLILDVQICVIPTQFRAPWYKFRPDLHRLYKEMADDDARQNLIVEVAVYEKSEGSTMLVLSHRVEHVQKTDRLLVMAGVRCGTAYGDSEVETDKTLEWIEDGRLDCIVGTFQSLGTGVDLPKLDCGILATPLAGNKQEFGQGRGRFCRAPDGKAKARLYYLWDQHVFGLRHLENLVKWNNQVVVRESGGAWVEGREYLRNLARARQKRRGW